MKVEGVLANKNLGRPRPQVEDYLRGFGYLLIMTWAVLFAIFPPGIFFDTLAVITRTFWMSLTFLGGLTALVGSLTRIDIKMEFPGLLFCLVGPLLYSASQLYYVIYPVAGDIPSARIALIAFALIPGALLLPRAYGLYAEGRRMKRLNRNSEALDQAITLLSEKEK